MTGSREVFVGGRWPDARQALLLRAALLDGAGATGAWERWRTGGDLDDVDPLSYAMLPLAAKNLLRLGCDDPELGRLKGIYRRTWYNNRVLLHAAAGAVQAFQERGIPALLLKGAPLLLLHYRDAGLRVMSDVDLLVQPADAPGAVAVLGELGWTAGQRLREPLRETFEMVHGAPFDGGAGKAIDLHSHALEECCYAGADDAFWAASRALTLEGVETRTLSATDLLLQVCIHGSRGAPARVIHWIADAMALIRDPVEAVDWDRLVDQTQARRLSLALGRSLRYLAETFEAPIPAATLTRLDSTVVHWVERLDYRAQGGAPAARWMALRDVSRYLRLTRGKSIVPRAVGFPRYLQYLWGMEHSWQLPGEALERARTRVRQNRAAPRQRSHAARRP